MLHPQRLTQERDPAYYAEIAEQIENKVYFQEAISWYREICLLPVCERSYLMLLTAAACFAFTITVLNLQIIGQTVLHTPFMVPTPLASSEAHIIRRLSKDMKENPQLSVAKFMVQSYVEAKENYSPELLQAQSFASRYRKIKTMSSKNIFNRYRSYMSHLNDKSPFKRYGDRVKRDIEVYSVQFNSDYLFSARAKVKFRAYETEVTAKDAESQVSDWSVDLHFRLSDISAKGAPIKFQVTSYEVRRND